MHDLATLPSISHFIIIKQPISDMYILSYFEI